MGYKSNFRRYELKYLLSAESAELLKQELLFSLSPDKYGPSTVRNVYYDTGDFRLIRRSIEKPIYKEKLRVRSYSKSGSSVFVELKRKYDGVVYKRRIALPENCAEDWLSGRAEIAESSQISREIQYFINYYPDLSPKVFLSYEREAYFLRGNDDFRVTFDKNILARTDGLSVSGDIRGERLLGEGSTLMEIKCGGGIPLFITEMLSRHRIYKSSFSKYGTAYKNIIMPMLYKGVYK
ncbi:MAG: polyphosphate polymerase domain-containing protein [Clostridia bacterium]|nr:polyphosphate polymerase domain-containing protein [Clostridia bacterium]